MPETIATLCSLMAKPGDPPKPKVRPDFCPKDGVYIVGGHGGAVIYGQARPIVFEGRGNDRLVIKPAYAIVTDRLSPEALTLVSLATLTLAALVAIVWRALRSG